MKIENDSMKSAIRAVLAMTAASGAVPGLTHAGVSEYDIEIERESLGTMLVELSRQTGVNVSYVATDHDDKSDLVMEPLKGRYTVESALGTMLGKSDLTYVPVNERTFAIVDRKLRRIRLARAEPAARTATPVAPAAVNREAPTSETLEVVIVTAQKREERLQDVPISISVLGGDHLDQSTAEGISEALNRVPGVVTTGSAQGAGAQVAVRGVSASGPLFNGSSPIAYYLDSIPFGLVKTAIVPDSSAYDLQRIEVLRGPQGTLYGASAQNGVVRILTKDASLDDFEAKTRASTSNTQYGGMNYRADAALNAPIVPGKLAARAVVGYEDLSGWIDKPTRKDVNDAQLRNARIKVGAKPTDNLSLGILAWVSRADYGSPSTADDSRRRASPLDESTAIDYDAYSLKGVYEFPGFSVASMTSYIDYTNQGALDFLLPLVGSSGLLTTELDSSIWSEEVIINSTGGGAWRWSFGGMYRDGKDRLVQTLSALLPGPVDFSDTTESFAVFGEVTRVFLDGGVELTLGLRHFEDDVTQYENVAQSPALPGDPVIPPRGRKFDANSPRVVLTWHPSDGSTLYGSYSEGFRSGFNQNANIVRLAPQFPSVEADNLKNYEIGSKGSAMAGKLSYEAAVFYIDWEKVQQTLTVGFGGVPTSALVNGESASGMGFEFGLTARPAEGLELSLSFSWNDLEVDSALNSVIGSVALYEKGDRLNFSPEYVGGASAEYLFPIGNGGYTGRFAVAATYNSEQLYRNLLGTQVLVDESDAMLIGRTSFSLGSPKQWTASIFVDNVTNEQKRGVTFFHIRDFIQRVRPRTAGLQLEYHF